MPTISLQLRSTLAFELTRLPREKSLFCENEKRKSFICHRSVVIKKDSSFQPTVSKTIFRCRNLCLSEIFKAPNFVN